MEAPAYWGVAGQPISHSVTPKLFSIVGDAMGLVQAEQIFVEASGEEEFLLEGRNVRRRSLALLHCPSEALSAFQIGGARTCGR